MIFKILKQMLQHKLITGIISLLIIVGGYFTFQGLAKDQTAIQYVMEKAGRDTLIVSVEGSGQVSASDQLDIKSKVSGDMVYVGVENDQEVETGTLLFQIDTRDAEKAVQDAETSLETAELELEELLSPPDAITLLRAENTVLQAKNSLEKLKINQETEYQESLKIIEEAEEDIEKAYDDALNTITDAFWDLPTTVTGIRNILYSYDIAKERGITSRDSTYQPNEIIYFQLFNGTSWQDDYQNELSSLLDSAEDSYSEARIQYESNFENYKDSSYYSEKETIEFLLEETIEATKSVAQSVKDEANLISFIIDYLSDYDKRVDDKINEYKSDLRSYTSDMSSHLSNLLSIQRTLEDSGEAKEEAEDSLAEIKETHPLDLETAEINLQEKEEDLVELKADPDELDVRAKEITIQQKKDALFDAQQDLSDHYIYASFDGVITNIDIKEGESISSSAVATLITEQKVAEITLNEIDITQVKIGQKANITFDVIDDLNITGEVVEVDTLGKVTQGVVTYDVKISFDTQDEQVKLGMSISAVIITNIGQDALVVPNSAIKNQDGQQYVEVLVNGAPQDNLIETGISNDLYTEIIGGLEEGTRIITGQRSISSDVQSSQSLPNERNNREPSGEMQIMKMMK